MGALNHPGLLPELLDFPNNILGLEYIKALKRAGSSIQPTALKRAGAGYHDDALTDSYSSATAVRKLIRDNDTEKRTESVHWSKLLAGAMPESSALLTARRLSAEAPVWEDDFSLLLCYQLMRLSPKELAAYSDMSPELARRIHAHLNEFHSYSQFSALLKTRELTYTRINRALLHVLLGIKAERGCPPKASYARILGFRKNAGGLLKEIKANADMTLITKAADYGKLLAPQSAKRFEQDLFASNLYSTVRAQKNGTTFVNDIQKSPVILDLRSVSALLFYFLLCCPMAAAAVSTAASACFAGLFVFHDFSHDQPHYTEQDQQNQDCSSIHIHLTFPGGTGGTYAFTAFPVFIFMFHVSPFSLYGLNSIYRKNTTTRIAAAVPIPKAPPSSRCPIW